MTQTYNRYEGTNGTNISVSSLGGSGTTPAVLVLGGASTPGGNSNLVYDSASALSGSTGAKFTLQASTSYLRFDDPTPGGRGVLRVPVKWATTPTANTLFGGVLTGADAWMSQINVDSSNRISCSAGTAVITTAGARYTGTAGTQYWVELAATKGTTTTDGRVEFRVYAADGTTLLHSYDSGAAVNTGTADAARFRVGGATTASGQTTLSFDSTQHGALASGFWGPLPPPGNPPVASVSQTKPYAIIDATASTGDNALSYSIGLSSGGSTAGSAVQISAGKWIVPIPESTDVDSVWQVIVTDTVNSWTDSENVTITKQQEIVDNSVPVKQFVLSGGSWV